MHFYYGGDIVEVRLDFDSVSDEKLTDHLETILSSIPETIDLEELVLFLQNDVIPRLSNQIQL